MSFYVDILLMDLCDNIFIKNNQNLHISFRKNEQNVTNK